MCYKIKDNNLLHFPKLSFVCGNYSFLSTFFKNIYIKKGRLTFVVLCTPGPLTLEMIYILIAKYAIIFLHSQNIEMIAFLVIDLKALLPLVCCCC